MLTRNNLYHSYCLLINFNVSGIVCVFFANTIVHCPVDAIWIMQIRTLSIGEKRNNSHVVTKGHRSGWSDPYPGSFALNSAYSMVLATWVTLQTQNELSIARGTARTTLPPRLRGESHPCFHQPKCLQAETMTGTLNPRRATADLRTLFLRTVKRKSSVNFLSSKDILRAPFGNKHKSSNLSKVEQIHNDKCNSSSKLKFISWQFGRLGWNASNKDLEGNKSLDSLKTWRVTVEDIWRVLYCMEKERL